MFKQKLRLGIKQWLSVPEAKRRDVAQSWLTAIAAPPNNTP